MLPCVIQLSDNVPIRLHVCTWQNTVVHGSHWHAQSKEQIPVSLWNFLACSFPLAFFFLSDLCSTFNGNLLPTQVSDVLFFFSYLSWPCLKTKKTEKTGLVGSSLHLWFTLLISVTSYVYAVGSMHSITTSANRAEHG